MIEPIRRAPARPAAAPSARGTPSDGSGAEDAVQQLRDQEAIDVQREAFDFRIAERAELAREADTLRDMMLDQLKDDDEALKKYIAMI